MINIPLEIILTEDRKTADQPINQAPTTKRFWPSPPFIQTVYQYQDVNKDPHLRANVTKFFYNKLIKWITKYDDFKHLKTMLPILESSEGKITVYKILRKFVKNSGVNWYDLRDNYELLKKFIKHKLN